MNLSGPKYNASNSNGITPFIQGVILSHIQPKTLQNDLMRWQQICIDEKRSIQNDDINFKVKPRDNNYKYSIESVSDKNCQSGRLESLEIRERNKIIDPGVHRL